MSAGTIAVSILAPALAALAGPARGQNATLLVGRVVSDSGVPLAAAIVTVASGVYSMRTDSLGLFRISGMPGSRVQLEFRAPRFVTDTAFVVLPRVGATARDFVLRVEVAESHPAGVLRGLVTDSGGSPIGFANVQVNGGRRLIADDSGRFAVPVPVSGTFTLLIRRIGFTPEEVRYAALPDSLIRVAMRPVPSVLPETRVSAGSPFASLEVNGFYRRMQDVERGINHGYFVTPEELNLRRPVNVTDAVEQFPSIRIRPGNAEQTFSELGARNLNVPRNMRIEDRSGCPLTVYLDHVRVQPRSQRHHGGGLADDQINALALPAAVAGIEVYPRMMGAPPEFPAVAGTCGVVLIWTKQDRSTSRHLTRGRGDAAPARSITPTPPAP